MAGSPYALVGRPMAATLFLRPAGPVTAAAFLHDAHAAAAALPGGGHMVNLCRDRYAFAVAFAAALLRGQICLSLGETSAAMLAALAAQFPGCHAATDDPDTASAPLPATLIRPSGRHAGPPPANPVIPPQQPAAIVFTSGSTGAPMAHRKLWGALADRSRAAGERFGLIDSAPTTVVGTVPPQHMYGFETTVLLPLHAPAASWCGPAFFPGDVQSALAQAPAPRLLVTTPLQMRALLHGTAGLPLEACISATAPLDPALAAEAESRWAAPVLEIFGATECGSIASRRTIEGDAWTAYPGVVLHRDADTTTATADWAEPVALADELEPLGPGVFRLLGRRTDLVKMGGRRASLVGLNRILTGLDGVADGTFVVPDDLEQRTNARLLAVVVAPGRSSYSILAELRRRVDPLFLPRRVIRVPALPRNEFGKLPRQALLALLAQMGAPQDPA